MSADPALIGLCAMFVGLKPQVIKIDRAKGDYYWMGEEIYPAFLVEPMVSLGQPYWGYKTDSEHVAVYDQRGLKYIGTIWIGPTGEWNVQYAPGETYLPINETLVLLDYPRTNP